MTMTVSSQRVSRRISSTSRVMTKGTRMGTHQGPPSPNDEGYGAERLRRTGTPRHSTCVCAPIYIRIISFTCNFYIPEHYRRSLIRVLRDVRDVDLHPQTTCRRRHELPNPTVCTPYTSRPRYISTVSPPHTEPTHFFSRISENTTT
jgi:hypothetical protein